MGPNQLGEVSTWCHRVGAYQVGASTWCISTWCKCNIDLVHIKLVQYRVGAKKHIFCMNSEIFFANVLHFFTKILFDK